MSNAIVLFEVTVADGCQDAYLERAQAPADSNAHWAQAE